VKQQQEQQQAAGSLLLVHNLNPGTHLARVDVPVTSSCGFVEQRMPSLRFKAVAVGVVLHRANDCISIADRTTGKSQTASTITLCSETSTS
jgi:hypothetical protein